MTDSNDLHLKKALTSDQRRMLNILRDTTTSLKEVRNPAVKKNISSYEKKMQES